MIQAWQSAISSVRTSIFTVSKITSGKAAYAIVLIAVLHSLIYLPLKIRSARQSKYNRQKMLELKPALAVIEEKYRREPGQRLLANQASHHGKEVKELYQQAGISFSPGCIFIMLPSITGGLLEQAVASIKKDDRFKESGILWFKDLTQPDRYFIFQAILMGISFLDLKYRISTFPDPEKPRKGFLGGMIRDAEWSPLVGFLLTLVFRKGPNSGLALYHITTFSLKLTEDYFIKKLITDSN